MFLFSKKPSCFIVVFGIALLVSVLPASANEAPDQTVIVESGATAFNNINDSLGVQVDGSQNINAHGIGSIVNGSFNEISGIGAQLTDINGAKVIGVGAVAIGNFNTAIGTGVQMVGVNPDTLASDVQYGNNWIGYGAIAYGVDNTAVGAGTIAAGIGNTAIGTGAVAGVDGATSLGAYSKANAPGSVALGAGSVADRPNSVSVGRSSETGYEYNRQITNVAPGYYDTDAVNMSQLRSLDSKVERVGAMAFALSALAPLPYDPKDPTQYSAGIGTYNGEGAIALGVYHYSKPTVMYNAAIAMSGDGWEKSARAGITWRTGGAKPKVLVPAVSPTKPEEKNDIVSKVNKILAEYEK